MTIDIINSQDRGYFDFGWLKTSHVFSFGSYYNPERMGFGQLRVLNDDWVAPNEGFGTHSHQNMEILTIPLTGSLKHRDTLGNEHVIEQGEIQLMSAGTGIAHSEYNASSKEEVNFLQIWIQPSADNLEPSYQQKRVEPFENQWQTLVSSDGRNDSLKINQNVLVCSMDATQSNFTYELVNKGHGVFVFVISGELSINAGKYSTRDSVMLTNLDTVEFRAQDKAKVLVIETPVSQGLNNSGGIYG